MDAHDRAETRFADLAPAMVAGTRPLDFGNNRYEEGFVWSADGGFRGIHARSQPESHSGLREGEWFEDAAPDFAPVPTGDAVLGFLIGTELWREDEATRYRRENVDVLVAPRLPSSVDSEGWLEAGRAAAIAAGLLPLFGSRGRGSGVRRVGIRSSRRTHRGHRPRAPHQVSRPGSGCARAAKARGR